jgi:hypothetical protein
MCVPGVRKKSRSGGMRRRWPIGVQHIIYGRGYAHVKSAVPYLFFPAVWLKITWSFYIYPVFCPAIDSDIDGMLRVDGFREGPLLAAVFADIADGVKELAVINFYISLLGGEQTDNVVSLLLG